jgi:hypothetical protein
MPADKRNVVVIWGGFLQFPPRQKAASFTIDQVQAKIEAAFTRRD